MRIRKSRRNVETRTESVLPPELQASAPRNVVLTGAGRAAAVCAVALAVGAIVSAWMLVERSQKDRALAQEARDLALYADAQVVQVRRTRGDSPQVRVSYRFTARGVEYAGNAKLTRRDPRWKTIARGSVVRAGYLPSRPEVNWMQGYDPNPVPLWVVLAIPAGLTAVALLLVALIARQRQLLTDGRAAMARVTSTAKLKKDDEDSWRVHYEWQLMSGATRSAHVDKTGKAPAVDTYLPVIYEREDPRRHAVYPFSLVRAVRS